MLIQARVKNLNGDLHQPSGIRYVSRSFSVRCLVSLAYGKQLIFVVTLSVVVPQAIGIFLCNIIGDHTGEFLIIYFGGFYRHSMFLNCFDFSVSESGMEACFPGSL